METTNNDKPGELTPRPWNLHPYYDGKPVVVTPSDGGKPWEVGSVFIAKGEAIIAEVRFMTCTDGWPHLSTPERMKAHADFILRAVNSHDALVEALKLCRGNVSSLYDSHPKVWGCWLEEIDAALAKAEATQP